MDLKDFFGTAADALSQGSKEAEADFAALGLHRGRDWSKQPPTSEADAWMLAEDAVNMLVLRYHEHFGVQLEATQEPGFGYVLKDLTPGSIMVVRVPLGLFWRGAR